MPDRDFLRQVFEEATAIGCHWEISSFALRACISFARLKPTHQIDKRAVSQGDLLVSSTNAEHRLRCFLDHFNNASQRFRSVSVPGMTLATQNDVRRTKRLYAFQRDGVIRLGEYFHPFMHATEYGSAFARARALTLKRIIDEVDQRCLSHPPIPSSFCQPSGFVRRQWSFPLNAPM